MPTLCAPFPAFPSPASCYTVFMAALSGALLAAPAFHASSSMRPPTAATPTCQAVVTRPLLTAGCGSASCTVTSASSHVARPSWRCSALMRGCQRSGKRWGRGGKRRREGEGRVFVVGVLGASAVHSGRAGDGLETAR